MIAESRRWSAEFRQAAARRDAGLDPRLDSSPAAAAELLRHPDEARRAAAVRRLAETAAGRRLVAPHLGDLAVSDPSPAVRITSLRAWVTLNKNTRDPGVLRLLAGVVGDRAGGHEARDVAYQGLYEVDGRPVGEWPITRFSEGRFIFPDDVDWDYVKRCAGAGHG